MNDSTEKYWIEQQIENQKRFSEAGTKTREGERGLWQSIITIHSTVLAITVSLLSYRGNSPNFFLAGAWIAQIASIGLGLFIFKLDHSREFANSLNSFQFSYDMNEINAAEARGEYFHNQELRKGLTISALMKFDKRIGLKQTSLWTKIAEDYYKKFNGQLPSSKLFTEEKLTYPRKLIFALRGRLELLVSFFYILTFLAFASLLVGLFL